MNNRSVGKQLLSRYVLVVMLLAAMVLSVQAKVVPARDSEIRSAVLAYVKQKTANLGCEIRLKRFAYNDAISLPEGALEYEISAPQQWEGWGSASIAVIVRQGEKVVSNIPVRVDVEALVDMVVPLRQMDHGSIVTSGDVVLKRVDVSSIQGRYLGRIEDVVGKKTRSTIRANVPFKADQLEKLPLIKSGQLVTIVAENERIRVTLTGKARSAGGEGDSITVQNTSSLKEFPARVVDATTVMVPF